MYSSAVRRHSQILLTDLTILVLCVLENVGHFVCVILIWENMQRVRLCVRLHVYVCMCASHLV